MRRSRLFPLSCLATLMFALSPAGPARADEAPVPDLARAATLHSDASAIREAATLRFSDEEIAMLLKMKWWDWPTEKIEEAMPLLCSSNIVGLHRYWQGFAV
jgi:hypothetical protein